MCYTLKGSFYEGASGRHFYLLGDDNKMKKASEIKQASFEILYKSEHNGKARHVFDIFLVSLIILNVVAVICEPSIVESSLRKAFRIFEIISVVVFSIEYLLRIWVADLVYPEKNKMIARFIYFVTPMALIDIAAVLPFYIPFIIAVDLRVLRMLRIFRLMRIFKANRYTTALMVVIKVIKNKSEQLLSSLVIVFVLMTIASVTMFNIENAAQPDVFTSVFDAMWWSVATLTTVGYGDIFPITALGKVLAAVIAILGIGIVAIPTGITASGFNELLHNKLHTIKCPHCNRDIEVE